MIKANNLSQSGEFSDRNINKFLLIEKDKIISTLGFFCRCKPNKKLVINNQIGNTLDHNREHNYPKINYQMRKGDNAKLSNPSTIYQTIKKSNLKFNWTQVILQVVSFSATFSPHQELSFIEWGYETIQIKSSAAHMWEVQAPL